MFMFTRVLYVRGASARGPLRKLLARRRLGSTVTDAVPSTVEPIAVLRGSTSFRLDLDLHQIHCAPIKYRTRSVFVEPNGTTQTVCFAFFRS